MLFRTNAQSQAYEEALAEAGVPTSCAAAERFFDRPEVRGAVVRAARARRPTPADDTGAHAVAAALEAVGWRRRRAAGRRRRARAVGGAAALVGLAEEFAEAARVVGDCRAGRLSRCVLANCAARGAQHAPPVDGVTLASLHSAKGLEWDAVLLVGLIEGALPTIYAKTPEAVEEERRLLYVGITRAREYEHPALAHL